MHTHTHARARTHTHTHIRTHTRTRTYIYIYQSFIYSPTDAPVSCLNKPILKFTLKFTLKQLQHVSVLQLRHHEGAH